jgi:hypothetical protein
LSPTKDQKELETRFVNGPFSWLLHHAWPLSYGFHFQVKLKKPFQRKIKKFFQLEFQNYFQTLQSKRFLKIELKKSYVVFFVFFCMPTYFYSGFGPSMLFVCFGELMLPLERFCGSAFYFLLPCLLKHFENNIL